MLKESKMKIKKYQSIVMKNINCTIYFSIYDNKAMKVSYFIKIIQNIL